MAINAIPTSGDSVAKIQRWEYLTMSYNYSYGSTTYEVNGEKIVKLKNKPLHETLTLLGRQGWELVSATGDKGDQFVFKRPAMAAGADV